MAFFYYKSVDKGNVEISLEIANEKIEEYLSFYKKKELILSVSKKNLVDALQMQVIIKNELIIKNHCS